MDPQQVHNKIASVGVRIFKISLQIENKTDEMFWVHPEKTTAEWRIDLSKFLNSYESIDPVTIDDDSELIGGFASDGVFNQLNQYLHGLGYHEIDDIISDVYEGRITNEKSQIVDYPAHEEQKTGFGHYGWESKK